MSAAIVDSNETHRSQASGLQWRPVETVYYDCHIVSLAQLLPPRLFAAFLLTTGAPTLATDWGGLSCRNLLDSEGARDVVLLNDFGVEKHYLPIEGDIEETVRRSVREHGHAVARVDSYYHEHFAEYYMSEHRTNGHKVTVIDYDDDSYYGIDNVGPQTLVLRFGRALFVEAMRSNMVHVYEKNDSLYRLHVGMEARRRLEQGVVAARERTVLRQYLAGRANSVAVVGRFAVDFTADLAHPGVRRYAQLANSYHSALMVERAYTAMIEAHLRSEESWGDLPDAGERFVARLGKAVRTWQLFKMMCRAAQGGSPPSDTSLAAAANRLVEAEAAVQATVRP